MRKLIKKIIPMILICLCIVGIQPVYAEGSNKIAEVTFSVGVLDQEFKPDVINYVLTVPTGTKRVEVEAIPVDSAATVKIGGQNLSTGKIVITVQNGGGKKYYTFVIKYSSSVQTTTTKVTTPKATTTTTTTTTATTSSSSELEESTTPEVTTSEGETTTTTTIIPSSKLSYLGIDGKKLNRQFNSDVYDYTVLVDDLNIPYEIQAIAESPEADIHISKSNQRYIVEVTNNDTTTTYVIKLEKDSQSNEIIQNEFTLVKNAIVGFLLLAGAIILFVISRKLSKE